MAQTEKMVALILAVQATLKYTAMHAMRKMEKHAERRALPKHTTQRGMESTVSPFYSDKGMYYLQSVLLIVLFLLTYSSASATYLGLFAKVDNVADNDTLNIREKPDYHSRKTGALAQDAFVGVDHCKKMGKSTWCKVFPMPLRDYNNFVDDGKPKWVNARYLKFDNRTYVDIDGKQGCDYALKCKGNKCEVVVGVIFNPKINYVTSLQTRWVTRKRLKAGNNFVGATGCDRHRLVEQYLRTHKEEKASRSRGNPLQKKIQKIVSLLSSIRANELTKYMHPKKGVVMTWSVHFGGKDDITFTHRDIKNLKKNRLKKIDWGHIYGKGDKVRMSLYDYMAKLAKPLNDMRKIKKLNRLKGFHCPSGRRCKGYEVFWIDEHSTTKEYDWQGLVVILEKYQGKWYVVGLLRDRWTI